MENQSHQPELEKRVVDKVSEAFDYDVTSKQDEARDGKVKSEKYSGRKTFAFSDESMYNSVESLLEQKPGGLTNAEFLHQALRSYVETEDMHHSFNHLPTSVVDIFKGDLEKLNVAFEMIRETFKTQMTASTQLIHQREERLKREFDQERQGLNERLESLNAEVGRLIQLEQVLDQELSQLSPVKEELAQTKATVTTLQQALVSEQERVVLLQKEVTKGQSQEWETLKASNTNLKELVATTTLQNQHLETQLKSQQETHVRELEVLRAQLEEKQQSELALKTELKSANEQVVKHSDKVQELYQQLLNQK